jgi:uncharacterized tellurite resistance protein B-like protein
VDDVSHKRLERVEVKTTNIEKRLEAQSTRLEQVHGLVQTFRDETASESNQAAKERRAHHAEQMKAFQEVVSEIRSARDQKVAELEAAVALLKSQVAELLSARRQ